MSSAAGTIGGILGGAAGAAFGGPAGAQIGYGIGSSVGGMIGGNKAWKDAQSMKIDEVDPRQKLLLQEIQQRRRALDAGKMYQPQQQAITQMGMGAMDRATRATGGDVGAAIQALSMLNRGTGRNLNELFGQMQHESTQLLGQQAGVTDSMANRSYQVQAYQKAQAMGDAARQLQNSQANMSSIMGSRSMQTLMSSLLAKRSQQPVINVNGGGTQYSLPQLQGLESMMQTPLFQQQNPIFNI